MEKRPPKTLKEKAWVAAMAVSENGTEAALKVYNTTSRQRAGEIAYQNSKRLQWEEYLIKHNLGPHRYFAQMDEALAAEKWNDFTGEREADHRTRADYHKRLGKILKIETDDPAQEPQKHFHVHVEAEKDEFGIS